MSYEPYHDALVSVKGIGPATAAEIMEKYPTADDLKAALASGDYDGPFPDELTETMAGYVEPVDEPEEEQPEEQPEGQPIEPVLEEEVPKEVPKAKPKPPKKVEKVRVLNRSMQEVRFNLPNLVVRIMPGRTMSLPVSATKTKLFKQYEARRWLQIL